MALTNEKRRLKEKAAKDKAAYICDPDDDSIILESYGNEWPIVKCWWTTAQIGNHVADILKSVIINLRSSSP